jgi:hypothetical protein
VGERKGDDGGEDIFSPKRSSADFLFSNFPEENI